MKCTINWFKQLKKKPLLFTFLLLAISILFVDFRGEFAVNDDWLFLRQLEAFDHVGWAISSVIDPSFIAQGLIGYGWADIFGYTFESVRVLTIIITFGLVFVTKLILEELDVKKSVSLAVLLLVAFNPIVFSSMFSFMTENYYLFFYAASIYFVIRSFKYERNSDLIIALVLAGIGMLIRQLAIVIFIAYFITVIFHKKLSWKNALIVFALGGFSLYIYSVWPRYMENELSSSLAGLISNMIPQDEIGERLKLMLWSLPYFAFFILPLAFFSKGTRFKEYSNPVKVLSLVGFYFLAEWLYKVNVFPVGSVFYLEGLHAKSNFRSHFSIFNNIPFKLFFTSLLSLASVRLLLLTTKLKKLDETSTFLLLTVMGSFAILLFGNDFYERYMIPAVFSFVLFVVYYFKDRVDFQTKFQGFTLVLFICLSVFLQHEYFSHTRLRWEQAIKIQQETGYVNSIFVDGTYSKHFSSLENNDYKGYFTGDPPGKYECYVQTYTIANDTPYYHFWDWLDKTSKKHFDNPEPHDAKRNSSIPKIQKHTDEILYNEEYQSVVFNLIGKKAYVGSWCNTEKE